MSDKLNELSGNVIVTIQGSKKQIECIEVLRSLYFYLKHSNEMLTSTTFNFLLAAFQNKENTKFDDPKLAQLCVSVLALSGRTIGAKQLSNTFRRVGQLLKPGVILSRDGLCQLICGIDYKVLTTQPVLWHSLVCRTVKYTSLQLSSTEIFVLNSHIVNFIRSDPSKPKRSRFSRAQKFYGPNNSMLSSPLTVLCNTSGTPAPILYLHTLTFSMLRQWIAFIPPQLGVDCDTMYMGDVGSVYEDDLISRVGGLSRAPSIISRQSTLYLHRDDGLYSTKVLEAGSGSEMSYTPRLTNVTITTHTGNSLYDAALQHCTLVIEHCDSVNNNSKDKVLALAAYLEAIKIMQSIYEQCRSQDVRQDILSATIQILKNLKTDKKKFILIPSALKINLLYNPDFQLAPEQNEMVIFVFTKLVSRHYDTLAIAFEIIMLSLEFSAQLQMTLSHYFPNLFKILAWQPTTFAKDFSVLLPSFYHSDHRKELLGCIVELPTLCALHHSNIPTSSTVEWMRREESGSSPQQLTELHKTLKTLNTHVKVISCCDLAPVMLKRFFDICRQKGEFLGLFPLIFNQLFQLYPNSTYTKECAKVLLDVMTEVSALAPSHIINENFEQITRFLSKIELLESTNITVRIINVLISPICKAELPIDRVKGLHALLEQQSYILTAVSRPSIELIGAVLMLIVVLAAKDTALTDKTLEFINNIQTKLEHKRSDSQSLKQLVALLCTVLQHGGGSIIEVYKASKCNSVKSDCSMLNILQLIEKMAKI